MMAWLERKGRLYRIRFRHGGAKLLAILNTDDQLQAQKDLARFEDNLRLVARGRLEVPAGADIGAYLLSDGKLNRCPLAEAAVRPATLQQLFSGYQASRPSKEATTRYTEDIHLAHLERLLGGKTQLAHVMTKTLQDYVATRRAETSKFKRAIGSQTVRKEIGTFAAVWNGYGVRQGIVTAPAPTAGLDYGKEKAKPPFQTRDQIEHRLRCGGLSADDSEALWNCLFLTLPEVEAVLDYVQALSCPAYIYPMVCFAAHTGARRSEILRSRVSDLDFVTGVVHVREKKKDPGHEETYRNVPLTPRLTGAMQAWLAVHPGGPFTICTSTGKPISVQLASKTIVRVLKRSAWAVVPGWHCFRHSFISNCVAKAIDQRLIDHWVGHTTEAMRRRYSHLVPKTSQAALLSVFGAAK
jgi:integrase